MSTLNSVVSLEKRIQEASKVMKITEDKLWSILNDMGIDKTDQDILELIESETTTEIDAEKVFVQKHNVPVIRFKSGWLILKNKEKNQISHYRYQSDPLSPNLAISLKQIGQYKDEELLKEYNEDCSSEILDELIKRSSGRPFIVFSEDGKIDLNMSIKMLRIARRQPTSPNHVIMHEGKSQSIRLYPVGSFPTLFVEQCPIHSDIILVDGYCERCDNTFNGISDQIRQDIRIYIDETGDNMNKAEIHQFLQEIREHGSTKILEIPSVYRRLQELKEIGRLPILKHKPSHGGKKDPFFVQNRF